MQTQEPLTVSLEPSPRECWNEESTASTLRALAVRHHSTGISLRETAGVLEQFGIICSHQAVFQWVHRIAEQTPDPPQTCRSGSLSTIIAVTIETEQQWLYATIDVETKLLLRVRISERYETDLAAVFLSQLAEKHDLSGDVSRRWYGLPDRSGAV